MSITAKQIQEHYDAMTPEEKAIIWEDLRQSVEQLKALIDSLAKTGQGIEWDGGKWVIVDSPGINSRIEQTAKGKRIIPTIPDVFANGRALVSSSLCIQAVIHAQQNAASGGDKWQYPEGHPPFYVHKTKAGSTIVEYLHDRNAVLDNTATASLSAELREYTDLDNDVLLGEIAHLTKGPRLSDGSIWFFASNMLDYRGIQPIMKADTPGSKKRRRAGHRQEDIIEIGKCVHRTANIWLTIEQFIQEDPTNGKKKQGKRKEYTHKGRLLSIDEIWYQRELDMGSNAPNFPIGWRIRPGTWLQTFLETPNRQVAWLCQKTLQYDPYREQWEKRLSTYFMLHMRMNGGGQYNREIGPLLSQLSLPVDKSRPERTKQRFEKAMNQLVADGQIDDWKYAETINYKSRKWVETWLTNKVTIYIAPSAKQVQDASK